MVDNDRIQGSAKQVKGTVKEAVGKAVWHIAMPSGEGGNHPIYSP